MDILIPTFASAVSKFAHTYKQNNTHLLTASRYTCADRVGGQVERTIVAVGTICGKARHAGPTTAVATMVLCCSTRAAAASRTTWAPPVGQRSPSGGRCCAATHPRMTTIRCA
eukprot:scaffold21221_cov60-Phaeocystis_antarctica.AAC.6